MPKGVYDRRKSETYKTNEWVNMYSSGLSLNEIARRLNVPRTAVLKEVKKILPLRPIKKHTDKKFFESFIVGGNGCWEWTGILNSGYGTFKLNGKNIAAHRFAYRHYKGEIPERLCVCHTCDNRKCVNPDHLFLGTHLDNFRDMIKKGRHPFAISEERVREIRRLYNAGVSQGGISQLFSIHKKTVQKIVTNRTWIGIE